MFGSQILEVGIGLIMVFLLVSLILTAVRETIESWSRTRARDLELAIAELLNDRTGDGLRKQLFEHPLVSSLFPGGVTPTRFDEAGKVLDRASRNFPSYIPREVFSLALQEVLKVDGNKAGHIGKAYDALLAAAGGDAERARKGVEKWYDAAMDRASGWSKRRTHRILLGLGIAAAILLNINAIAIAQYLATNEAARTRLGALADRVDAERRSGAAEQAPAGADATDGTAAGNEAVQEAIPGADNISAIGDSSGSNPAAAGATSASGATSDQSAMGNAAARSPDAAARPDDLTTRLDREIRSVGLPIGWDEIQRDRIRRDFEDNWLWALVSLIVGYLIVGFAATLGAPFWFDLLGKFMVVRSTVKPTEKSPDETSKDGGTGGSPKPASGDGASSAPATGTRR
jgi:hypothetical protein